MDRNRKVTAMSDELGVFLSVSEFSGSSRRGKLDQKTNGAGEDYAKQTNSFTRNQIYDNAGTTENANVLFLLCYYCYQLNKLFKRWGELVVCRTDIFQKNL